ncbi:SOS response-associated peptidase [Pseudodesulfovibrio indicus]|uniref:SOS response-associated peptidase n=1 Tax=Pseudodesulfovibrio indicus TaxID=1716143 RepID=UPI002931E898|nr:SOS response-associated peptidase [Pseudodesulfovibrio indicus]
MCGRFALGIPKKRLEEVFGLPAPEGYAPRYNAVPGTDVLAVSGRGFVFRRWGLVPSWADDPKIGWKLVNARAETVFDKPSFREGARSDRLLVPAQAFYEWRREDRARTPFAVEVRDADCFALAAVGSVWTDPATGGLLKTLAVLTCAPNALMAPIHDRMPVILPPSAWAAWLDPGAESPEALVPLLAPYPADAMRARPVSARVNSPVADGPELLEPVPSSPSRQGSLL